MEGEFTFVNEGGKPIQILHVLVSCKCQEVEMPRAQIAPGKSLQGKFKWDAREDQGESGAHFKVVYKIDNEEEMRNVDCVVRADILAPFGFGPKEVEFSLAAKEVQTAVVDFWASESGDFVLEGAECRHPALLAECMTEDRQVVVFFDPSKWHKDDLRAKSSLRVVASNDPGKGYAIPIRILK